MDAQAPLTLLFAMLSEAGHHTGTFRLARALRDRGHRVVYVGLADLAPLVVSQGFAFVPFAADSIPAGHAKVVADALRRPPRGLRDRWRKRRADERRFAEYLRRIGGDALDECLRTQRPDVVLCDTFVWYIALRALRLGMPVVDIATNLALQPNWRVPPITSALAPGRAPVAALAVRLAWVWLRGKFFFTKRLASRCYGTFRSPARMHHLTDVFLALARRAGYPCRRRTWSFGEMGPRLALPEIVLCPAAFQLPGGPQGERRYLADFVDLERREEPLPELATVGRPLVYCSLGSSPHSYPHAERFFAAVVGASRIRRDWSFVLHVADHPAAGTYAAHEPSLQVHRWVPQLSLLRDAAVMVTHGGLNSIMECIHFQVPMVIVPGARDQPGNAVRAAHHGLAVTAAMSKLTPAVLVDLVARAMRDPRLRAGLAAMKQAMAAEPGLASAVAFIEERARRRPFLKWP